MSKIYKLTKQFGCFLFVFCSTASSAQNGGVTSVKLPLPPRVSLAGTFGNNTFGEGDAMFPLYGNPNKILFGDVDVKVGDDSAYLLSLGLGARKVINNDMILGAYLFGDYNKSPNANYFTVLSPGVEYMSKLWDVHLNGYLPVGRKCQYMGTFTGSQVGETNTVFFRGHSEYDSLFNLLEDVGPGAEVEVGRIFPSFQRARVSAGTYFFTPKYTSNVNGLEAGIQMPLKFKGTSVEARDSYDNVNKNTFVLTVRWTFGGLDQSGEPDIHSRMLDRIPRHLGNLNNGNGIPSQKKIVNTGRTAVVRDNIWFFNPGATQTTVEGFQSCTFENPCLGLSQTQITTINGLSPNANFYLNSGTYNNPNVGNAYTFFYGQNVFGRTNNFMQLATGNDRPLLNDSVVLSGNNNIYNLQIVGNSELSINSSGTLISIQTGILVAESATGTVNVNNTDVFAVANTLNAAGVVNGSPTATLNINNSTLNSAITNMAGGIAIGSANISSGTLNINNTTINVSQSNAVNNFDISFGVVNNESGTVNISNTEINVSGLNGGLAAAVLNNSTVGQGTINISNSTLTVATDGNNLTADVFNQANNGSGVGGTVNINQSTLSMTSNNNAGGTGAGIFNTADSTVNVSNSSITANGNDGTIAGIINADALSKLIFQNNRIAVNLTGTAVGAPIVNGGTATDNGGNQCFQNGVPVAC